MRGVVRIKTIVARNICARLHEMVPAIRSAGRLAVGFALLATLSACYSFAISRTLIDVSDGRRTTRLVVRYSDQGIVDGTSPWYCIVMYPINMVAGLLASVQAPFDENYDIEYGIVGAMVGTFIPGFTVLPSPMRIERREVSITTSELTNLEQSLRSDHRDAYVWIAEVLGCMDANLIMSAERER